MGVRFERLEAGMVLYERRRVRMGHTTMLTLSEWPVRVGEVDVGGRRALVSWNGNRPEWRSEHALKRLSDWSMRNPDDAIVSRSTAMAALVYGVRRRPKCATCKNRHASELCPG
jgi:hypothetical protein